MRAHIRCLLAAALLAMGGCTRFDDGLDPAARLTYADTSVSSPATPVWFDGDFGCGENDAFVADVDDCAALLLLVRSDADIVGISTTAGNVSEADAYQAARLLTDDYNVHRGGSSCEAPAVRAFATATAEKSVTVLAMAPLSNVALFIECGYAERIERIVFVGGKLPGETFVLNPGYTDIPLTDMNVRKDPAAMQMVVRSNIPLTLVPFEAGKRAPIGLRSLEEWGVVIPQNVRAAFERWDWFTTSILGARGMPLWDLHATATTLWPRHFDCTKRHAGAVGNELVVDVGSREVDYCLPNDPDKLRHAELGRMTVKSDSIARN